MHHHLQMARIAFQVIMNKCVGTSENINNNCHYFVHKICESLKNPYTICRELAPVLWWNSSLQQNISGVGGDY